MQFEPGQMWTTPSSAEADGQRLIIGAILGFEGGRQIACCAVTGALQRRPDGAEESVTIPFLPMTLEALSESVSTLDGTAELPDEFPAQLAAWHDDPRGQSYFTVPFEGSLERMIAHQMAAIVEQA